MLQHPLVRLALLGPVFFLLIGISNGFMAQLSATPVKALGAAAGMALLGLAIYWGFVRLVERRPVRELSLSGMGRELSAGMLVGAGLCVLCFVVLILLGTYRIDGVNHSKRLSLPCCWSALARVS